MGTTITDAAELGHVIRIMIVAPLELPGRKFMAKCKCKWKSSMRRYDRQSARQDGNKHLNDVVSQKIQRLT